ncbi:MAG: citrate lyase acyl carrier protein [Clostridiales bacterium]|jgi:citrate lyase subunit gamma (acyl carrier protein)|nr:citrate lyase acyl carrier protein [Clostridiales bacterium]
MEIKNAAVAGTLESSDCMVTVEPAAGGIELELESAVMRQYGDRIREVAMETLDRLDVRNARVSIVDKGALDCTIKARVECAVMRAAEHEGRIGWGGVIR